MTATPNEQGPAVTSIDQVLDRFSVSDKAGLKAALLEREDAQADLLRTAGGQFGLFPEIVAEVITEIGIGTPPDEVTREFIRSNFTNRMAWIQEQQRGQQPPPGSGV
jgi:hypothetical protein